MFNNLHQPLSLAGLPFDVLLKIFSECDVNDVLNLSVTCKRLSEASEEHQTWLNQVKRLRIPIPIGVIPSTTELKDWAISWLRSDRLWVKPPDDDDDRSLNLHCFKMGPLDDDGGPSRFVMANFIPGGRFVVVLYNVGYIDLKEVNVKSEDEWELLDVTRYRPDNPEQSYAVYWSQLLTETNLGRPLVAYVDHLEESLLVFLVDHIAGTIEQKLVVNLDGYYFYRVDSIHARGNIILCLTEHNGWGIIVSELGSDPALKMFNLNINAGSQSEVINCFMVSENAVVICDLGGIHLYHIPELSSAENYSTLGPVWEWRGESKWFRESIHMTLSQHPMICFQEASATHTIIFRMDACRRDPIVVEHRVGGGLPVHPASPEDDHHRLVVKGRKGLRYNFREENPEFDTFLVGMEELAGGLNAVLELPEDGSWDNQEVRLVDFDEMTGRILIGAHRYGAYNYHQAIRIYLADLPP